MTSSQLHNFTTENNLYIYTQNSINLQDHYKLIFTKLSHNEIIEGF